MDYISLHVHKQKTRQQTYIIHFSYTHHGVLDALVPHEDTLQGQVDAARAAPRAQDLDLAVLAAEERLRREWGV